MKRFDLHVHTPYCGHADGSAEETVHTAIRKQFDVLGFSEHFPYPEGYEAPLPDCVVPRDQWDAYTREIRSLQKTYGNQLDIRFGVEIDYLPAYEKSIKSEIENLECDYVYGSVHLIDDIGIDYKDDYLLSRLDALGGADGLWEKYWQTLENLIRMNTVDILAHLDLPKKLRSAQPVRNQTPAFRHILELIKKNDLVIEINTGGIDRAWNREPYPSREILQHAAELGIEITLGSDSHAPEQIGRYFNRAFDLLKAYGWERVILFRNRRKESVRLFD